MSEIHKSVGELAKVKAAMRVLCVCQYGHSRSVAACRAFHARGVAAVACGVGTGGSALAVLADWATHVCVLDDGFARYIPAVHVSKIVSLHVGPDRWVNPYNQELRGLLDGLIDVRFPMVPRQDGG